MDEHEKFRRIGIRIFTDSNPGHMLGYRTEIYDVETGDFLPVIMADIHLSQDSLVTASVTLEVSAMEIVV